MLNNSNMFIKQGFKETHVTETGNGAKVYNTSSDDFVDQFTAISSYLAPRSFEEISKDMYLLWSQDPIKCLKLTVYMRIITRKTKIVKDDSVEVLETQKGSGLKHESILRMMWIAIKHPNTFKENIAYFIAAGSWKDIFKMLSLDLQYNGWSKRKLDWEFMYSVIQSGLINPETTHLVRKYLPIIKSTTKCNTSESKANTIIGRFIANRMYGNLSKFDSYKAYRKMKSEGVAHQWQQLISKELYSSIDFNKVAGRALALLVGSKFLENHGLVDKYREWISSKTKVNYTGFVFELFKSLDSKSSDLQKDTINAQFNKLLENCSVNSGLLVVRDTSSSMSSNAIGCSMTSYDIAKAMALYFSYSLKGIFANTYAEFARTCVLKQWKGNTPADKWINDFGFAYGDTNFQYVIDLFIDLKNQNVPESDFPNGLLLLSDCELDPVDSGNDCTNYQRAMIRLKEAGFSNEYIENFKIIMWDIPNSYYDDTSVKFEDFSDTCNLFYLSGYDPSVISFILEGKELPRNSEELLNKALNQSLLNKLIYAG